MTNTANFKFNGQSNSRRKFLEKVGLGSLILSPAGYSSLASKAEQSKSEKILFWDPFDFGARGDGKTLDTNAIQSAIDRCSEAGGGKVYLHNGYFISGTIYLKDNVAFYIESGTILKASDDLDEFPSIPSKYASFTGELVTHKMLIYAEDKQNITICGRGTIDGNGDHWIDGPYGYPSFSVRPRIIHFRGCENIQIRDVTLFNSASWVLVPQSCRNILIDGVYVNSRPNPDIEKPRFSDAPGRNCDGFDILDCQKVRISNCFIVSGDDSIVFKSNSPDEKCADITVTNCVISSNASGIKTGTDTAGAFEDITISNCTIYDTRGDGIALLTADGARVERINISNITMRNIKGAAIAVRLGNRFTTYRQNAKINIPSLKNIIIENIQGTRISYECGCSIRGFQGNMVENIVLRNINLQFEGGGEASESYRKIPQNEKAYPSGRNFGVVPAYGFYINHARNIIFDNVRLNYLREDNRPVFICDNVEQLEIKGLKATGTSNTPELVRLVNTRDVLISDSHPPIPVKVFVNIEGKETGNIYLINNILKNVQHAVKYENETLKNLVTESGNIK